MFNGAGPLSGSSSLQSYGESHHLPEQTPALTGNKCSVCHKTFERLYNLKVHLRKHTGETPYDCPIKDCKKQFKWRSSMAHHVRAHHDVSETVGIEVRCQARRSDQNTKYSNGARRSATQQTTLSNPGLSSGVVKKAPKKKLTPKVLKAGGPLQAHGFVAPVHVQTQSVCTIPQWGLEHSFSSNIGPSIVQNAQSRVVADREPDYERNNGSAQDSTHSEVKVTDQDVRDQDYQLLEMVSEIFSKTTDMLQTCEEGIPQIHPTLSREPLDSGLLFLADGSEDATDAEMESLAHYGANLSTSTSKETQTSCDIAFNLL